MKIGHLPSSQSGVALIVVLLFLILIAIAGAIAVRQSTVDLQVATSDHAGTLMFNASDSLLAHLETVSSDPTNPHYQTMMSQNKGVLGYFLVNTQDKYDHQLSICYQPDANTLYDKNRAHIRKPGNSLIATTQACNPDAASDYTSARKTAMTQLVVRGIKDTDSDDFAAAAIGTSEGGISNQVTPRVQIVSTSTIPALSAANASTINNCLGRPIGDASLYNISDGNLNHCLRRHAIPSSALIEEAMLQVYERGGFDSAAGTISSAATTAP